LILVFIKISCLFKWMLSFRRIVSNIFITN